METILLILLLLCSVALTYQDFKTRLISTWLVVAFGFLSSWYYATKYSLLYLGQNAFFCVCYMLFCYLILHLFYFFKTGKFQTLLNSKLGWGDVWIMLFLGVGLAPVELILFFAISFTVALLYCLWFLRKKESIAMAGILLICHGIYLLTHISEL